MSINMEIERKFLVDRPPDSLNPVRAENIEQGYIVAETNVEVRLRAKDGAFYQTVKRGKGLQREEVELELTEEQFRQLHPLTDGQRLEKTRHAIEFENTTILLDIYHGELEGLITAEVEFSSVAESEAFRPPDWFGAELTEDESYKNKNLALNGLPPVSP